MIRKLRSRKGNIVAMLMGTVAMVGIVGVSAMNMIGGPITTAAKVTHQNMAQNDLLMNAKVVVMNASTRPQMGDEDGDGYIEPVPFVPASDPSCGLSLPAGGEGGCLPADIGAILTDPWGTSYAYCVWDHGDPASSPNRIDGEDSTSGAVLAIISAGPNKRFETPCLPYDGDPDTNDIAINPDGLGDDLVQIYTYAGAVAGSGGLWELKLNEPETAVIDKKLEIGDVSAGTGFAFDTTTGEGEFPHIKTDFIASKSGGNTPVTMVSNLALDGQWLSGDGGNEGIFVANDGKVGIRASSPEAELHVRAPSYSGTVNPLRTIVKAQMNPTSSNGFSIFEGIGASNFSSSLVHGLKLDLQGGAGGRHYGFFIEGENRNYLSGKLGIGTTTPTSALHVYQSHAQLQDTPDAMVLIEGANVDNFVTENREAPTLLKVKTRYGNVPNGHLFSAENHLRGFRVSNYGNVFANVVQGDAFYPAVINPDRPTSYYSLFGTSLNSSDWFDGSVPIIGNSISLNVTNWGGNSPAIRSIYGVPVKIRGTNPSASSTAFYADVADAGKNWSFYAKAGDAYFADRVGIGTTTPESRLHIIGAENTGTDAALRIQSGSQVMLIDGNEISTTVASGQPLYLNYEVPNNVVLANGGGNVGIGIGTGNPTEKLQVNGLIDVTNNRILRVATPTASSDAANKAYVDSLGGRVCANGQILKYQSGAWQCAGDNSGGGADNLGNHTATANLNMSNRAIVADVGTIRDASGGWVRTYGATGWYNQTYGGGWHMQDTTWIRAYSNKSVVTGGNMQAAAFLYGSDERLKADIRPLNLSLDDLDGIGTYRYHYRTDEDETPHIGVIAQEVQAVFPEAVQTGEDGMLSVDYPALVPVLLEAVKQLKAENDAMRRLMKEENDNLREEIRALTKGAR